MVAPILMIFALAAGIPNINIQRTCLAAKATGISTDQKAAYDGCIADEREALQTLRQTWGRLRAADRQSCVDEATGLAPSYVELLTCLEMRDGGKFTGGPGTPPPAAAAPPAPAGAADIGTTPGSTVPVAGKAAPTAPGAVPGSPGPGTVAGSPAAGAVPGAVGK